MFGLFKKEQPTDIHCIVQLLQAKMYLQRVSVERVSQWTFFATIDNVRILADKVIDRYFVEIMTKDHTINVPEEEGIILYNTLSSLYFVERGEYKADAVEELRKRLCGIEDK